MFAHAIPVKGDDEDHYVADLVASDVSFMGHTKVIIKPDNEPALRKLANLRSSSSYSITHLLENIIQPIPRRSLLRTLNNAPGLLWPSGYTTHGFLAGASGF